jgi:hypothetical protein
MSRQINFLAERRKDLTKQEKIDKRILEVTGVILGMSFAFFLVVTLFTFYLTNQLRNSQVAQKTARSGISENRDTEESFVIFAHKLSSLAQIYQTRQEKKKVIDFFSKAFNSDVLLKAINFNETEKVLVLYFQSDDIFAFKQVLELVNSPDVANRFNSLTPSGLVRNADGTYEITLTVSTQKKIAKAATAQ